MSVRGAVNDVLKILGVVPSGPTENEAREERRRRKRAMRPEALQIPGTAFNRAARRLAAKNGVKIEVLVAMQRAGLVEPRERRIDKKKIEAFKAAAEAGRKLRNNYGLKDETK